MTNFEQQKNIKASTYTLLVLGMLLAICFLVAWTPPAPAPVPQEEGMEVNLGDSETGSGDIQPLIPEEPAAIQEVAKISTPPPSPPAAAEKEIETNDNDKEAPPAVVKKPIEKAKPKKEIVPKVEAPKPVAKPKEEKKPTPPVEAPPKPKALYKGPNATGKGGNNSDSYQKSSGQGNTNGKGDQGKPTGSPDSDSYTGNGGTGSGGSGISISTGLKGRNIIQRPSFEDEFNENAKVAVDIKVDPSGKVINATIQPRGTTTGNASMKAIALQKARQLKFNPDTDAADEQLGTIVFNFRVRN